MVILVIDIQKGITDSRLYNYESFLDNTIKLLDAARKNHVEVIYIQHDDGPGTGFSLGDEDFEIADQVAPKKGEKTYIKNINSKNPSIAASSIGIPAIYIFLSAKSKAIADSPLLIK